MTLKSFCTFFTTKMLLVILSTILFHRIFFYKKFIELNAKVCINFMIKNKTENLFKYKYLRNIRI